MLSSDESRRKGESAEVDISSEEVCVNSAGVFFNPDTLQIFAALDPTTAIRPSECLRPTTAVPASELVSQSACRSGDTPGVNATGRPQLSRLTLHISNTCNLGCTYCYASGGDYGLGRKLMTSDNAISLLAQAFV